MTFYLRLGEIVHLLNGELLVTNLKYCNSVRMLDGGSIQDGSLLLTNIQHYS
jgi:hypothetical protein